MKNTKPQITEKRRRTDLIVNVIFVMLIFLYVGMRIGYFLVTGGVNEGFEVPEEGVTLLTAIGLFINNWMVAPYMMWPTHIVPIGMMLCAGALGGVMMYNKYLITKDTVENAHGDAHFEENYDQYEREFVCNPKIIGKVMGIKINDKTAPCIDDKDEDEEHKRVMKDLKYPVTKPGKYKNAVEECRRQSMIFTDRIYLSLEGSWSQRNSNAVIFGSAGTGKSRYVLKPNVLQGYGSLVITDPSCDIMQSTGYFLEKEGYKIKCFNLSDMSQSCRFNPLAYISDTEDIAIIVQTFLDNISGGGKKSGGADGDFWVQSAKSLMCAAIGYLDEVAPEEQRNFANVAEIIKMDRRDEDDTSGEDTPFDTLFKKLGEANPGSYAFQQYLIYSQCPVKTRLNIAISTSVNLSCFDIPKIKNLTYKDEMELDKVGEEKMAIFLSIPQADTTFCWLSAMMYSLLFKRLYRYGENRMKQSAIDAQNGVIDPDTGKVVKALSNPELLVPTRMLIDECANIGKIPNLEKYLATCRKYRISIVPIFQNFSQIQQIYGKEVAQDIISNCDSFLFLGGSDEETLKVVQGRLGKETVKVLSNSMAQSARGSNSASKQQVGTDLMTRDQIETMSNKQCILFIRSLRPFKTKKYNLNRHPNYKYLDEGKEGKSYPNPFHIEYEDEEIESVRIKSPNEAGYIAPKVVDSVRRRALVAESKPMLDSWKRKKESEMKRLEAAKLKPDSAKRDAEIEEITNNLEYINNEIKRLSRIVGAPVENAYKEYECAETKTKEQHEREVLDVPVDEHPDLSTVIEAEHTASGVPTYEFPDNDEEIASILAQINEDAFKEEAKVAETMTFDTDFGDEMADFLAELNGTAMYEPKEDVFNPIDAAIAYETAETKEETSDDTSVVDDVLAQSDDFWD